MDGNIDKEKNMYFSFFEIYCGDEMKPYGEDSVHNSKLTFRHDTLFFSADIVSSAEAYFPIEKEKLIDYLEEWVFKKFNLKSKHVI
jgi:hypothetical protein